MWICQNQSFLSVVADRADPRKLLVRARVRGHIESVFPKAIVFESVGSDYKYRTLLSRRVVKQVISTQLENIQYDNFKNSVEDDDLHNAYLKIWSVMRELQRDSA
jgi:hypothetical protein